MVFVSKTLHRLVVRLFDRTLYLIEGLYIVERYIDSTAHRRDATSKERYIECMLHQKYATSKVALHREYYVCHTSICSTLRTVYRYGAFDYLPST